MRKDTENVSETAGCMSTGLPACQVNRHAACVFLTNQAVASDWQQQTELSCNVRSQRFGRGRPWPAAKGPCTHHAGVHGRLWYTSCTLLVVP
jgi:hypothetical protein